MQIMEPNIKKQAKCQLIPGILPLNFYKVYVWNLPGIKAITVAWYIWRKETSTHTFFVIIDLIKQKCKKLWTF